MIVFFDRETTGSAFSLLLDAADAPFLLAGVNGSEGERGRQGRETSALLIAPPPPPPRLLLAGEVLTHLRNEKLALFWRRPRRLKGNNAYSKRRWLDLAGRAGRLQTDL